MDKYKKNTKKIHDKPEVGIINGLWANAMGMGGIISIEVNFFPSPTFLDLKLTGLQGDVMKESMNVAKTLAWKLTSKPKKKIFLADFDENKNSGIHIHWPEGATPKDGPSAGIGMVTSIVSAITDNPVRRDVAMTGEVTLTGQVLPIGGLKEKLLAAHRAGIKQVIIPKENEKDLIDMPKKITDDIIITPVEHADEVLKIALTKDLKRVEWVEVEKISKTDEKSQASIQ